EALHDIKTGTGTPFPGKSMVDTYLPTMRCPVYRQRESHSGFRTELENLAGDGKGKGASGKTARPKVPMRQSGADCSVVCAEQRVVQEGQSPSGARMRGAISKRGGNPSRAGEGGRYGEA